ncbi:MAG: FkbM family methyltransferase [Alphaproteobacteria bacterium]|nr:FkbM family methyltransferase [Alphaproteobacteria bacterium]
MSKRDEFWIDGARARRSLGERIDRRLSRLIDAAPGRSRRIVVRGAAARVVTIEIPNDPGVDYVASEVLAQDCYPVVPGVSGIATIVDVGANVGIAAARLRLAYPDARILCFEPNPSALSHLRANAAAVGAELFECGLADADARLPLYAGRDSTVTASLHRHHMTGDASHEVSIRAALPALRSAGVSSIDILKIDTEGAELPILRSLKPMLAGVRILHLEFHSEADRREIQAMIEPTHSLWAGHIAGRHAGQFTFVRADLVPVVAEIGR